MAHADLRIGREFQCDGGIWPCMNGGTRTAIAAPERVEGAVTRPELSAADTDILANEPAQHLSIDSGGAIRLAGLSYLGQLDSNGTRSQSIARIQAQARKAGTGTCSTDHKALMDVIWGES